jgi:glycosyltransferase involved in cell wall biosynthesis
MPGSTRSYEMARRLVMMGHQVEIITSTRNLKIPELVSFDSGIKINWIKNNYSSKMGFYARVFSFIHFAIVSFWKAKKINGDLIFASSTPLTVSIPGIFAARLKGIPFYFEVRDLWPSVPIAMGYLKNPLLRFLAIKLEKFSYTNSKGIIALSKGMKDGIAMTGYPLEKIILIPNGADLDLFDCDKSEKNNIRLKYGFNQNDIIILYPGTFGTVNNLEYLVDLAKKFTNYNNVKFILVGDGIEKELIVNKAKSLNLLNNNMFFFDMVPKKDIPNIFSMSDIVISTILPIKELEANSANKYFDALASGTCLVINHGGWQEDELTEFNCGFRLPRNIEEAYLKLLPYLENRLLLSQMGRNARLLGEKKYSRDNLAKKMVLFFEN